MMPTPTSPLLASKAPAVLPVRAVGADLRWKSVIAATILLADAWTSYTITVTTRESGEGPPNGKDYLNDPMRQFLKNVLNSYAGLDGITPQQIHDDIYWFFPDIVTIKIVDKEGIGFEHDVE